MAKRSMRTLKSICLRSVVIVHHAILSEEAIKLLPSALNSLIERLHFDIDHFVRSQSSVVHIEPEWISITDSFTIDYSRTFERCLNEIESPVDAFRFASINAQHQVCEAIWHRLNDEQRHYLARDSSVIVTASMWQCENGGANQFAYTAACEEAASMGWSRALLFWLAFIDPEHFCKEYPGFVLEEEMELQRYGVFHSVRADDGFQSMPHVEPLDLWAHLVILSILNRQWAILKLLPLDSVECAFHRFFPDGRIKASFLELLAMSPQQVQSKCRSVTRALLKWIPRLDREMLIYRIENNQLLKEFVN
ncbi:unnamed protein product, partial [Anisakis simplex]|uniref:SOCS box domain-containing protein n=1 Tax=Anisakis simplex TaxID=6269 RepID=A0A0M3KJ52_ANISI